MRPGELAGRFEALTPARRAEVARRRLISCRTGLAAARQMRRRCLRIAADDPVKRDGALALLPETEQMIASLERSVHGWRWLVRDSLRETNRAGTQPVRRPVVLRVPRRRWACRPRSARSPPRRTDDDPPDLTGRSR